MILIIRFLVQTISKFSLCILVHYVKGKKYILVFTGHKDQTTSDDITK